MVHPQVTMSLDGYERDLCQANVVLATEEGIHDDKLPGPLDEADALEGLEVVQQGAPGLRWVVTQWEDEVMSLQRVGPVGVWLWWNVTKATTLVIFPTLALSKMLEGIRHCNS